MPENDLKNFNENEQLYPKPIEKNGIQWKFSHYKVFYGNNLHELFDSINDYVKDLFTEDFCNFRWRLEENGEFKTMKDDIIKITIYRIIIFLKEVKR